jgi:hypothetical protein
MERKHKSELNLVVDKIASNGANIYKAEPFQSFYEECDFCQYFLSNPPIAEGGKCTKHNIGCGWGLTCNDFIGKQEKEIKGIKVDLKGVINGT